MEPIMELRHLRYFVAVADTLSFTEAAAECAVAQSALSQQIARMEKYVGAPLFSRSSRHVRLTEAGTVLLPWARRLLAESEQAMQDVEALSGLRRGRLRLGVIQSVHGPLDLAAVLGEYRARHPGIELSVGYDTSDALLAALLDGELDLALVGVGPERIPAGLGHRVLHEDRLVAVVSARHRLAADPRGHIDLAELSGDEFIWFGKGTGLRSAVEAACARAGLTPRQDLEIGLVSEMVRCAAHGVGVAVVPASAVTAPASPPPAGARVLRLADPQAVHSILLVHPADRLSAAATAFVELIAARPAAPQASAREPAFGTD
jgi:DNA-binding transcriptional LysR family regulator